MPKVIIPTHDALMNPLIQALKILGGSGTVDEIAAKVAELANLTDDQLEVLHSPGKSSRTEVEYRLAWSRTFLKRFGVLENSSRAVWALTAKGRKLNRVDEKEVVKTVREQLKKEQAVETEVETEVEPTWRDEAIEILRRMSPAAFERLTQRLLRESGFTHVEVTGRSGDGGVDGKGLMRLAGLLSFHVIFQCKKWQGSVSAGEIRDFRGAMVGRADKGLFITTGTFTKDAIREATRDGAPPIDLVDGEQLLDKLKELGLGVKTQKVEVEEIFVDREWFGGL